MITLHIITFSITFPNITLYYILPITLPSYIHYTLNPTFPTFYKVAHHCGTISGTAIFAVIIISYTSLKSLMNLGSF